MAGSVYHQSMEKTFPHIYYRAAGGVVTHEGKILVLERASRTEVRLPKGHMEPGEDPRAAALRETAEESGYCSLEIIADLGVQRWSFFDSFKQAFVTRDNHFYLMRLTDTARDAGEAQFSPVWVTLAEAESRLTFEEEREFVRRAAQALTDQ